MQYDSKRLGRRQFIPLMLLWTVLIHIIVIATLVLYFDVKLLGFAFLLSMLTAYSMGIFHHMQLTHSSFESKRWVTRLGALLGTLTWRGAFAPPLKYAAVHQVHHEFADQEMDPHSPIHGLLHSFMGWFWLQRSGLLKQEDYLAYVSPKWKSDPVLLFMDRNPNLLQFALAALLFVLGGWPLVLYGIFVKTLIVLWAANTVDVINHTIGYRNFETADQSTNSFLMAGVHLGGAISWHNNHHARPDYFSVSAKWWEFDVHHWVLKALSVFGLVWNIKVLDLTREEIRETDSAVF